MTKYRGRIRITQEMLESIIALPEGVDMEGIQRDISRNIYEIYLTSNGEVEGWTFATGEAQEPMDISGHLVMEKQKERVVKLYQNIEEEKRNEFLNSILLKDGESC